MPEARGRDAENRVEIVVETHRLADDVRVGAEKATPEPIADDGDLGDARAVIARREDTAALSLHPEHREVVGVDKEPFDALGAIAPGEVGVDGIEPGDRLEDAGAITPVEELGDREADVGRFTAGEITADADERARPLEREVLAAGRLRRG